MIIKGLLFFDIFLGFCFGLFVLLNRDILKVHYIKISSSYMCLGASIGFLLFAALMVRFLFPDLFWLCIFTSVMYLLCHVLHIYFILINAKIKSCEI